MQLTAAHRAEHEAARVADARDVADAHEGRPDDIGGGVDEETAAARRTPHLGTAEPGLGPEVALCCTVRNAWGGVRGVAALMETRRRTREGLRVRWAGAARLVRGHA